MNSTVDISKLEGIHGLFCHTPFDWKRPLTFINAIIRMGTGNYDHVAYYVNGIVIEMTFKHGYRRLPYSVWKLEYDRQIDIKKSKTTLEEIEKFKDCDYDNSSALWCLPIYRVTKKWLGRKLESAAETLFCFEMWAKLEGIEEWWKWLPNRI